MNARTWYAVTRPDYATPTIYSNRPYAEAICTARQFEYPDIGPWEVVELREVVAQVDAQAVAA